MNGIAPATAEPPSSQSAATAAAPARARAPVDMPVPSVKVSVSAHAAEPAPVVTGTVSAAEAATPPAPELHERMDSVVQSLQTLAESQSAARREIVDAAEAALAAHRSRMAMLQDASLALETQANTSPGMVLSLLQAA